MALDKSVSEFIRSSFRSVWSLELLLHLKRHADRSWTSKELVAALRGSELIVKQGFAALLKAGLVTVDDEGCVRYQPASATLEVLVSETESLYARSPDAVRRMIVTGTHAGLSAFAEAFRLGKD